MKINCDASFKHNKPEARTVFVCRDNSGKLIQAECSMVKCNSPLVAEAIAVRDVCRFALHICLSNIVIESDSEVLVKVVHGDMEDVD